MRIPKAMAVSLILIGVMVAAALVPVRMYHGDIKALKSFVVSYERFDGLMPGGPPGDGPNALSKIGDAMRELQVRSDLRLSSLIKNDAELMAQALEVAELSRQEFENLRAFEAALSRLDQGPEQKAKAAEQDRDLGILRDKRKAAFARFLALSGQERPGMKRWDERKGDGSDG